MDSKRFIYAAFGVVLIVVVAMLCLAAKNQIASTPGTAAIDQPATPPGNVPTQITSAQVASPTAPATVSPKKKNDFRYIQERLNAMQERRPEMNFDPAQVAAAVERDVAWSPLAEIPKELPLTAEEFNDGREFIALDSLKIETLMPGDRIRIPVKALEREYEVTIDTVEKHDYNSISWNGHIEGGDGQNYHATFTRGASLTVGGMETPDGEYELQANGNKGWIASANLLFKRHVDPIDPNTVVPGSVPVQPHDHSTHSHEH